MDKPIGLASLSSKTINTTVQAQYASAPVNSRAEAKTITTEKKSLFNQIKTAFIDLAFEAEEPVSTSTRQYIDQSSLLDKWAELKPNYDFIFQQKMETVPIPRFTDYQFNSPFDKTLNQIV